MDEKLITVSVAEGSWAMGRNGGRDIGEITARLVAPADKPAKASLQFITRKRKILMNGGAVIDLPLIGD